ncbi:hypothetical protein [Gimesia chilikensis]|uniref:hypothetical protein n=1 Tax=Gimesia chilikensis TaxID=2605989 RepID=UPI003A9341B7
MRSENPPVECRTMMRFCLLLTGCLGFLCLESVRTFAAEPEKAAPPLLKISARVDLGEDVGQSFGSLFELRDADGTVIAGAGFLDVYNTRFRGDRHTLQFYVKQPGTTPTAQTKRLPHPDLDTGVYLLDLNQTISAWSGYRPGALRTWNPAAGKWIDTPKPPTGPVGSGDGMQRVGTGMLTFSSNRAAYNGRIILEPPAEGRYYNFYYAQGFLCFYHGKRSEQGGFTKVVACPWKPSDGGAVDLSRAVSIDCKFVGATPFAWGQYRNELLTVSNWGGVYVFDGKKWRTILEASDKSSYQVYSMLNFRDRLLLAQYPSGELFEYTGGTEIRQLSGWPPRLPGVSPSAREAQTLAIYRGDLFVGVWPWAELWRYDADADRWFSEGRMFSHPELTDKTVHPYEAEAVQHKLVLNHWGQRITGLVPLGGALMVSTSSKGTYPWSDRYTFLTDAQRREYGAVLAFEMPGNLAAQLKWKDQPLELEFCIEPGRLVIRQDGQEIGATAFAATDVKRLQQARVVWGEGVFGKLKGMVQGTRE